MEILISLAMKFWQWSLLILLVIIGFIINLLDKRKANITFAYRELPHLQPVKIPTKGKGFWKGIVMWLLSTRNWVVTQDWKYRMNGNEYIIPAGFQFDGASIPKFLRTFFIKIFLHLRVVKDLIGTPKRCITFDLLICALLVSLKYFALV